jgi:hypothetical protein
MTINNITLLVCLVFISSNQVVISADTGRNTQQLIRINVALEDRGVGDIKAEIKTGGSNRQVIKTVEGLRPSIVDLAMTEVADGQYFVFFSSPGYAGQWRRFEVVRGKTVPADLKVQLFRKRYVVIHYAFNKSGGRELSGGDMIEGRAAVTHWGGLPLFWHDWQIWQKPDTNAHNPASRELFGPIPYLTFHRYVKGFGFLRAPDGVEFDKLRQAPESLTYKCENLKAVKGLTLFCRVNGDRKEGLAYGKVMVEDVTESPPPGIEVIP